MIHFWKDVFAQEVLCDVIVRFSTDACIYKNMTISLHGKDSSFTRWLCKQGADCRAEFIQ